MHSLILKGSIALVLMLNFSFAQETAKKDSAISIRSVSNYWTKSNSVELGDYLCLTVSNLGKLVAADKNPNSSLVLYISNVPMKGITPAFIDTNKSIVVFPITKTDSSKQAWQFLYHRPPLKAVQPVEINIGTSDKGASNGNSGQISLRLFSEILVLVMLIAFLGITIGLLILAKYSTIIRDGILPGNTDKSKFSAFSLAKSQLAFWTLIILGSVSYVFVITGEMPIITQSTWILLAISIGTTAGASIINFNVKDQVIKLSKNWFTDVLSDNEGINIHRFQMLIWTAFLGIYFITQVYNNLSIPQISNELLALMGISSGAYLGLKVPEDKKSAI